MTYHRQFKKLRKYASCENVQENVSPHDFRTRTDDVSDRASHECSVPYRTGAAVMTPQRSEALVLLVIAGCLVQPAPSAALLRSGTHQSQVDQPPAKDAPVVLSESASLQSQIAEPPKRGPIGNQARTRNGRLDESQVAEPPPSANLGTAQAQPLVDSVNHISQVDEPPRRGLAGSEGKTELGPPHESQVAEPPAHTKLRIAGMAQPPLFSVKQDSQVDEPPRN